MIDGPRYVAGVQDDKDRSCYKDFFETETLHEAKTKADEKSAKVKFSTLVFDRKLMEIVYKKVVVKDEVKIPQRGKKKKIEEEDDYF